MVKAKDQRHSFSANDVEKFAMIFKAKVFKILLFGKFFYDNSKTVFSKSIRMVF